MARRKRNWIANALRVLFVVKPRQAVLVVIALFLSSIFELIGLATIVPLLASASDTTGTSGLISVYVRMTLEWFGLPPTVESLLFVVVAGLTLKSVISIAAMTYVANLMSDVTRNIRLALIHNLFNAKWSFLLRQPLGRLTHAAGPETSAVGEAFLALANLFAAILQALMYIAIAAIISWQLALVTVLIGFLMFTSFGHLVRRTREAAHAHNMQMRLLAGSLTDAMIGIKSIKAMGRNGRFASLFESDARQLSSTMRTRAVSSEYASELQEPLIGLCLVGGFYVATQVMSLALFELVIMALLLARTVLTLSMTQRMYQRYITAQDQCRSILAFLDETAREWEIAPGGRTPTLERSLDFDRVSFSYGEKPVLHDTSFRLAKGMITALYGPSGVGKSTIVDLIVGLHRPAHGRVLIDDSDLGELDLGQWRRMVGYVPQEVILLHDTIMRNVTLGETSYGEEDVCRALDAAGALGFVQELPDGLRHVVGERGARLSGGQRQRIAIARAVLHEPKILILDEATTGLDPATEKEICEKIALLARTTGLTVLAVSHQTNWRDTADQVLRIEDGVIVDGAEGVELRARSTA